MSEVVRGACLCGGIALEVSDPQAMGSCHCTRCQRWSGGAGSTVLVAAADNVKLTKGRELLKGYLSGGGLVDRYFCSNCGSHVYTAGGANYYVAAGILEDVQLAPAFHIQVAHKATWDTIAGDAPQFAEWPPA